MKKQTFKIALLLIGSSFTLALAQTNYFVGFTPSPDARCIGHSVWWGTTSNAPDIFHWMGNCGATDTNYCLTTAPKPPPNGVWISVTALGVDGTSSVQAAPVYFDTNNFPVVAPATTPLLPATGLNIFRQ